MAAGPSLQCFPQPDKWFTGVVVSDGRGLPRTGLYETYADEAALRQVITLSVRYIGMNGSRAKRQTILDHVRADGLTAEALDRVYAPIGLDLGGTTPQEVAVAILAEVIAVRHGGRGTSRSR
jgi:xanthine/CO dehydrogenase XdhC/CoxF family maturation factor